MHSPALPCADDIPQGRAQSSLLGFRIRTAMRPAFILPCQQTNLGGDETTFDQFHGIDSKMHSVGISTGLRWTSSAVVVIMRGHVRAALMFVNLAAVHFGYPAAEGIISCRSNRL